MPSKNILKNNLFRFLLLLTFLCACYFLGKTLKFDINAFKSFFSRIPVYVSGIVFILLYVLLTFFVWFGPKDVLRISSAVIFGAYISTFLVWISEMINAVILFNLSRDLGQGFVKERFKLKDEDIKKARENKGFIGTLAIRFNPLIPFRFMDLGAGLSTIPLKKYFFACLIGSPLRIFWLQYILAVLGDNLKVWARILMNSMNEGSIENYNKIISFASDYPGIILVSLIYFISVIVISVAAIVVKMISLRRHKRSLS